MTTMENKYIPTWERNYNKWETEPEIWENETIAEPETKDEDIFYLKFMQSLDEIEIEEIELDEETNVAE